MLDGGGLVFERLFSWWKEGDKLCYRKCFYPIVEIVGIGEDVIPGGIEEGRQFPPSGLWTMAEKGDFCFKKLAERKRKTRKRRKSSVDGRRSRPGGEVAVIGGSM